jgi:flagellar export protein FliJ
MAIFRFRLAPVLRQRERLREEKRLELAALEEASMRLVTEIDQLETLLHAQAEALQGQGGKWLSGADLRLQGEFAQQTTQRLYEQRELLAAVQRKLAEKRVEVLQANRAVKSLEQLRSRLQQRHRWETAAAEQKLVDEVGQRGYRTPDNERETGSLLPATAENSPGKGNLA